MSDRDLRAAERALATNPHDRAARLAYSAAWERAGFPIFGRDPRRDPRPGDVIGPARLDYYDEEGRSLSPPRPRHPDFRDLSWEGIYRFVVTVELDDAGKVVRVGWLGKLDAQWPPEPERHGPERGGWTQRAFVKRRRGTIYKSPTWCSIAAWRRAPTRNSFPGDVPLWIEPDVWLPAPNAVTA